MADSGLTAREFAAEVGVNANTLAGWKWRLSRGGERRRDSSTAPAVKIPAMKFVEVTTAAVPTAPSMFEVVLRSGLMVRVPARFDAGELARLVVALEEVRA